MSIAIAIALAYALGFMTPYVIGLFIFARDLRRAEREITQSIAAGRAARSRETAPPS